jgi:hypothetical protein
MPAVYIRATRVTRAAVALVLAAAWAPAAAKPTDVSESDKLALPQYCQYTQGEPNFGRDGYKYHMQLVGPGFHAMHHYCWGLLSLMRVDRISYTPQQRRFYLRDAISEFEFVIRNWRTGVPNILIPEILTKQAGAMLRNERVADAIQRYREAADLRPTYWPAFLGLAEAYLTTGDKVKARDTLADGLRHSPDARQMLALFEKLGGDRRTIVAAPKPTPADAPKPVADGAQKPEAEAVPAGTGGEAAPPAGPADAEGGATPAPASGDGTGPAPAR